MSEQKKPNHYTSEFKFRESVVKLAIESNQPISITAEELGLIKIRYIPGSANTVDLRSRR